MASTASAIDNLTPLASDDPQAREQSGSKRKADVDPLSSPDPKKIATPKYSPADAPLEIFTPPSTKLRPSLSLRQTPQITLLSALHAANNSVPASPTALQLQATTGQPTAAFSPSPWLLPSNEVAKEDPSPLPTTLLAAAHRLAQLHEGQDPQHAAHAVQAIAARHIAERLLAAVEKKEKASKEPLGATSHSGDFSPCPRPTAGVSYVVKSESRQIGAASGTAPLPHLMYRSPAAPQDALPGTDPRVAAAVRTLMTSPTVVALLPLKDEAAMKCYLFDAATRHAQLQAAGGSTRVIDGATDLPALLQDRLFVCLHYRIERNSGVSGGGNGGSGSGSLSVVPCSYQADNGDESSAEPVCAALESSNLQLGVIVKKGVGGTWPLRCAARRLQGALGLLTDDASSALQHATSNNLDGNEDSGREDSQPAAEAAAQPAYQRLSLNTASCRLELYVDQKMWQSLNREERSVLQSVVSNVEVQLSHLCEQRNWERLLGYCRSLGGSGSAAAAVTLSSALAAQLKPLIDREINGDLGFSSQVEAQPASIAGDGGKGESSISFAAALVLAAGCAASLGLGGASTSQVPWPQYLIGTRDHFSHHLLAVQTPIQKENGGRSFTKTEWFFRSGEAPADYQDVLHRCQAGAVQQSEQQGPEAAANSTKARPSSSHPNNEANEPTPPLPAGITTYTEVFSASELDAIEAHCDELDSKRFLLPPACLHSTYGRGGNLKRTKYFFGARYLWTREQLSALDAQVARGVRVDVPLPPTWVKASVEAPLAAAEVLPPHSIDSVALNVYHDGSEGLQSHFDDSLRFQQPIFSLRLFSDCRMSFGTQLYGYNNGMFCIPMPRGCVTVMEAGGYAVNGVKHCIRPVDMTGKSAGMILRRMEPVAMQHAKLHFIEETTEALRRLSLLHTAAPPQTIISSAGSSRRLAIKVPLSQGQQVAAVLTDIVAAVEESEKRKALAEAAGLDVAHPNDAEVCSLVHGMVSYCEAVANPGLVRSGGVRRKAAVNRTAAARKEGGAALEVAAVMQNMVRALEAAELAEKWMEQRRAAAVAAASAAARLLVLAQAAATAVLCGAAPDGVSETEALAAVQAVLVGAKVESVHALKQVLLGVGGEKEEGELEVIQTPAAQFQLAVGLCYRALCVAASSASAAAVTATNSHANRT